MVDAEDEAYNRGKQEVKVESLEKSIWRLEKLVENLTKDVKYLMFAVWGLYGAIALIKLLPELKDLLNGAAN